MLAAVEFESLVATLFLDVALVVIAARLMGGLFRRLRQPPVVGEILAGIMLGPTILGTLPGDLPTVLFPMEVRPYLGMLAQLGLVIFMFIVGLELDLSLIKGKERVAAGISVASVALPFVAGVLLASWLHQSHGVVGGSRVDFLPFALFIGASMSVTAFPVLARILTERGMHRTQVGALALASAAVDDVLAWSLLAVVLAVVASDGIAGVPLILVEAAAFAAVMFGVVKPRLAVLVDRYRSAGRMTPDLVALILVGILVSSWVTSTIGIHSIFGAFVFGAILPRDHEFIVSLLQQLENVTVLLLLPIFFIVTGLEVGVGGLGGSGAVDLIAIMAVAVAGKFLGAAGAARLQGVRLRRAAAIGTLMNTRGLTELVLLNIGREKGVLSDELFTLLVVMAILTTVMTEPLLRLFYPPRLLARDVAEAERQALGTAEAYRVLVAVEDLVGADELYRVARALAASEPDAEIVLSRFVPNVARVEVGSGLAGGLIEVADSIDQLGRLHPAGDAVRVVVLAQLSAEPSSDLERQASTTDANVLVELGHRRAAVAPRAVHCDRVVALPAAVGWVPGSDDVALIASDDLDGAAAAEVACRLARARGRRLVVVPGTSRRGTRIADGLQRVGADVVLADAALVAAPGVVIGSLSGGLAAEYACPVLVVQARPSRERPESELLDRLERLA